MKHFLTQKGAVNYSCLLENNTFYLCYSSQSSVLFTQLENTMEYYNVSDLLTLRRAKRAGFRSKIHIIFVSEASNYFVITSKTCAQISARCYLCNYMSFLNKLGRFARFCSLRSQNWKMRPFVWFSNTVNLPIQQLIMHQF